ncbi:CHASE2 domain-containing protein [uncultured Muribaculum sp.]|uniref:CHASE2 domain-containing protein n=1 Tax=uncultured Muribaculum sp. TaxID=1918613 RepID=UPI0025CFCF52|nr:CHASE2 domain-containing protein [uncultured Muribaculum sp.]
MSPFSFSATALLAAPEQNDFTINDFYNMAADGRAVRTLDSDIVIIDITECDRLGTAQVLDFISECSPRAVGIDIVFKSPSENDSLLIAALQSLPQGVLAETVSAGNNDGRIHFNYEEISFLRDSLPHYNGGIVNLPTKSENSPVREFSPQFLMSDDSIALSFASAVVRLAYPERWKGLVNRGNKDEVINYVSRSYLIFTPEEMVANADELTNKIVLVGAMHEVNDMHSTPVKRRMSGVEIHAHSISTILNNSYYYKLPDSVNWIIAFILAFVVIFSSLAFPLAGKGLILRILQISLLYIIIRVGYTFFVDHSVIMNFSYSLLMVTFGLFAADIWLGITAFGRYLICTFFNKGRDTMKQDTQQINKTLPQT